jgi:hypothetical protein
MNNLYQFVFTSRISFKKLWVNGDFNLVAYTAALASTMTQLVPIKNLKLLAKRHW